MSVFGDVHYCSYADNIVGGSTKVQECAGIIYGWSNWYTPAILGNSFSHVDVQNFLYSLRIEQVMDKAQSNNNRIPISLIF